MTRVSVVLAALAVLGPVASADCIVIKKGGKLQIWGMPPTIGTGDKQIEITPENVDLYADQSTGVIDNEGYDGVVCRKSEAAKQTETFAGSEVVRVYYSAEPDSLVAGQDEMSAGNYLQAVGYFKEVVEDPKARETFKNQALYKIGICYLSVGRVKECIAHYKAWKPTNSKYTPEAYRILGEILTDQRQFPAARAQYEEIGKLPGIPDEWKYKARLGGVRVDIAERKFDDAERMAQTITRETQGRTELADANVLALILQADSVWKAGKAERLPDAAAILDRAAVVEGADSDTRAFLFVTQGNVIYAQGKPEEARFPYMRAALMYPESSYDSLAYLNAGTCFLDMSGREVKDQARSDALLVKAMQLLATAAGKYKNPDARKKYAENKKRYDEIMAKEGGAAAEPAETPGK